MPLGLLAPLLGYLATLIPKAADEVAMSPIKQGVKRMYGENNNRNQQQGLMAAPPQQAPGLSAQMQQPMQSSDPGNALAAQVTMNPPQQQPQQQQGLMQQPHQNTDEGHSHSHPGMSALGDALVLYGQMTSPNGDPKAALQMIQQRRQAQAQAQQQAADVAREQANRREDIQIQGQQFGQKMAADQQQLKQGADQFAASEEDKKLAREQQGQQFEATNRLNTGKLELDRATAATDNQYKQGMLANAQAENKLKQNQANMNALLSTQIMAQMGLIPQESPNQLAMVHDTVQANNPGQPGMDTPQPEQQQPQGIAGQPGDAQEYNAQLSPVTRAAIAGAAMKGDYGGAGRLAEEAHTNFMNTSGQTEWNKGIAGMNLKNYTSIKDDSKQAAMLDQQVTMLEQQIQSGFQGSLANVQATGVAWAKVAGVPVSDELSKAADATQASNALMNQVLIHELGGSLGRQISDSDVKVMRSTTMQPTNKPGANERIAATFHALNQRKQEISQLADEYISKSPNHQLPSNFDQIVKAYNDNKPMFPPEGTGGSGSGGGYMDKYGLTPKPSQ